MPLIEIPNKVLRLLAEQSSIAEEVLEEDFQATLVEPGTSEIELVQACLLAKHCPYWVGRGNGQPPEKTYGYEEYYLAVIELDNYRFELEAQGQTL